MSSDQHGSGASLGNEYEHTAVPLHARRSTFSVSTVWVGAPMIITTAITGSILVAQMGFVRAVWAILVGNLLMLAYTGALAVHACRTGFNSALQASRVFGKRGYVAVSGLLSTLVLGWFAVQTGLAGTLISSAFGFNYLAMTALAGLLFLFITFLGIKGLHWIGIVSVPLFVVLGGWVLFDSASHAGWDKVLAYGGTAPDAQLAFGAGVTIVFALFADGATLTGDYSRWAPSVRGALISTASAFPFAMTIAMLVGGVMTAALQVATPNAFGHDNMFGYMLDQHSPLLAVIALVFLVCNLGSICSHCLYFSAVGFSRMTRSTMRTCSIVLGVVGTCIAAANVWALFIPWLSLLGIIVPPIGAVMIMDLLVVRARSAEEADWRATPFIAWLVGSVAAFWVEKQAPGLSTAVAAFVAAAVAYLGIAAAMRTSGVAASASR
jgi:cytosine permease